MIKINLAPPPVTRRRFSLSESGLGLLVAAAFMIEIFGLGAYWWVLSADVNRLNVEIQDNQKELARLKPIIAEGQRYKREKEDLERRVAAIETVVRNQARPAYLMDALADMLPNHLWLTGLDEKGEVLRLAGATYSSVALSDFMANLKASRKFQEVDLIESRQDLTRSPRIITFLVTCRFEI